MEKVIIFGLGEISQIARLYLSEDYKYEIVGFTIDDEYIEEETFEGLPIIPFSEIEIKYNVNEFKIFVPLSYTKVNKLREKKYQEAKDKGYSFVTYIHPKATIASNVIIGENCFIFEDNTIQPFVTIADNCILWSGNHIGHHSKVKSNCFISSHVVISGGCEIGENTFIGVNATLRDHIKIGKFNVIGAGAVILNNTQDNNVYMAVPTQVSKVSSDRIRRF